MKFCCTERRRRRRKKAKQVMKNEENGIFFFASLQFLNGKYLFITLKLFQKCYSKYVERKVC